MVKAYAKRNSTKQTEPALSKREIMNELDIENENFKRMRPTEQISSRRQSYAIGKMTKENVNVQKKPSNILPADVSPIQEDKKEDSLYSYGEV